MEYKKHDSRRGVDHGNRETYVPRQGKRQFDRHDGSGRGFRNSKKEGAGQHNWGNEVEEELNNMNNVDEVSQVPVSEQANIEKSEQIGKGIEEGEKTSENKDEVKSNKEKQLTLEEYRKQQLEARKSFQNKQLFSVRHERTVDFPADEEVQKISAATDEDLIKPSVSSKSKKKKVQRSQKTVTVETEVIGFAPNRRLPRADKPRLPEGGQRREDDDRKPYQSSQPRVNANRQDNRDRNRGGFRPRGRDQPRTTERRINIDDMKSFPVLKV